MNTNVAVRRNALAANHTEHEVVAGASPNRECIADVLNTESVSIDSEVEQQSVHHTAPERGRTCSGSPFPGSYSRAACV